MSAVTFSDFRVVSNFEVKPLKVMSGEAISSRKGKYLRVDGTTGKGMLGNASSAGEVGGLHGFAMSDEQALGDNVSLLRWGLVDVGDGLDALDLGAPVYLADSDSTFATTAGTVSTVVGRVWPIFEDDGTIKRLLAVDLR